MLGVLAALSAALLGAGPSSTEATRTASLSAEWAELSQSRGASVAADAHGALRLVYTGGTGGIGSGRYDLAVARELSERIKAANGVVKEAAPHHGALAQGLFVLVAEDRRLATALAVLEGGARCEGPRPARAVRTPKARVLIEGDAVPAPLASVRGALPASAYEVRSCQAAGGARARLYGPAGELLPADRLAQRYFETRLALHLASDEGELEIIGVPSDDPARRFRQLREDTRAPGVLYVDAGSFLDGTSTMLDGQLSLHRPLGLEILESLRPAALVPAETELAAGAGQLLREAAEHHLPYVASNWKAPPELELPEVIFVNASTSLGPVKVAFLGAVDPAVASSTPRLAAEGVELSEPVSALAEIVKRIATSSAPPELTVVLTSARWEVYEALQSELTSVDLVIGETAPIDNRTSASELEVTPSRSKNRRSAGVLPIIGATRAELSIARGPDGRAVLERVRVEPMKDGDKLEPDPEILARVTATRAKLYPPLDRVLVRPPGDSLSQELWRRLVCEAVRRHTGADVVLLPELPPLLDVLGPQTELLAQNGLGVADKLELHTVRGKKLTDVLQDAPRLAPIACGGQIGVRGPKVLGRAIDETRVYRVVSTDRLRVRGLDALIGGDGYGARLFDRGRHEPLEDERGQPLSLRSAVLTELRALRDRGGDAGELAVPSETTKSDALTLRINKLSFLLSSFIGADARALPEVKDTRANAPSALTLGGEADVQLVLERSWMTSDLRARAQYNRLEVEDAMGAATSREQADDWRLSTSLSLPVAKLSAGPLEAMPFAELVFDSEFTPVTDGDPRQAALFLVGGVLATAKPYLSSLKLGAAASRDFSTDVPFAFVLRTDAEAGVSFGYDLGFKLLLDGAWFAPTVADDATTLRFRYALEGRLALPLARWLAVGAYGKAFLFQGAGRSELGRSFDLGFMVDLSGSFAL